MTSEGTGLGFNEEEDLSFSEALKKGVAQVFAQQRAHKDVQVAPIKCPAPGSSLYGKWQSLSLDEERLTHESDINVSDSRIVRFVDQPGNEDDIKLWTCLLDFCSRRMGRDGVLMIWQSVFKRRNLHQVDGPLPQAFWKTVLNAALSSDAFLREVVIYAEWLDHAHNVQWPELYSTVMSYMLEGGEKSKVLRWNITLTPSFGPTKAEFLELMKTFITNPDRKVQTSLQLLYTYSVHRDMYDILIPYLYNEGHASLAMEWRKVFSRVNDNPTSVAARSFLRYLGAYYHPNIRFTDEELTVAGLVSSGLQNKVPKSEPPETAITGQNLRYLINRAHGETFGIKEKAYNDNIGAKWFASSWVSLDFAINVIYTMGIQQIGPLSLQSIALREGTAQGVLHRIEQLRQLKIDLPESTYVQAIQHYAAVGDDEALQELLHSDIHPDIFNNDMAQHELLSSCLQVNDWKTYRLILRTRLAVLSDSIATASNHILEFFVLQGHGSMSLKVMQEMSSREMELTPTTSHLLSSFIIKNLSPHCTSEEPRRLVDLQISLCRQLAATRFPPAVEVWQTLLYRLGREQRLADLERLSLDIFRLFNDYTTSDQPMWISHMADIPQILRTESPYQYFQKLPRDLPLRHAKHPLRLIFDQNLQNSIIRWGFMYTNYGPDAEATAAATLSSFGNSNEDSLSPVSFHFARGIRLLAMLRDRGLFIIETTVRKQTNLRLLDMYRGGGKASYEWVGGKTTFREIRRRNRLTLAEAKKLCDGAWGTEKVTPSLVELEQSIENAERDDKVRGLVKRLGDMEERY